MSPILVIREFSRADQDVAAEIVLTGLGERWGFIDRTLNLDLLDIAQSYANGCFLVGEIDGVVIATGALTPEPDESDTARMQRMSVLKNRRGEGFGKTMLKSLERRAIDLGFKRAVLETTETWVDAISFYQGQGYQTEGFRDGDIHLSKRLS